MVAVAEDALLGLPDGGLVPDLAPETEDEKAEADLVTDAEAAPVAAADPGIAADVAGQEAAVGHMIEREVGHGTESLAVVQEEKTVAANLGQSQNLPKDQSQSPQNVPRQSPPADPAQVQSQRVGLAAQSRMTKLMEMHRTSPREMMIMAMTDDLGARAETRNLTANSCCCFIFILLINNAKWMLKSKSSHSIHLDLVNLNGPNGFYLY